jgi:glycosyltransferase involved in cell wall biosynthesis
MPEDQPLVSILTPSYNQGAWIADCLHSVACQTYPNVEHIVCDGGSTDETVELLQNAGPRVRWVSEEDRGQTHALNKAFAMSSGEIIGWINSDDVYFDCGVFDRVVEFFSRHPNVDLVYGQCARIDEDGRVVWVPSAPPFSRRRLKWLSFIGQPAVFMRRSALGEELLDERFDFSMDWELWLRLSENHKLQRMDDVLAADRYQPARKNVTHLHVLEGDIKRMAELHGAYTPWFWNLYLRFYDLRRRLAGGRLIHQVATTQLAFSGYVEGEEVLRRRQLHTRRSRWSERDRIAGS